MFRFRESPGLYMLRGYVSQQLHVEPINNRGSFRSMVA